MEKSELRRLYESLGVNFVNGSLTIDLGAKGTIAIDENVFLEPSEENFSKLNKEIALATGIEFELFDPRDKKHQAEISGNCVQNFGRVFHHDEYVCCPIRQRRYYRYVQMTAPMSQVSRDSWEKMAIYLTCVLATLGILAFLGIITSGTSVLASVALFTAVAGACLAAMESVTRPEKEAAIIDLPIGR
jgi:small-conductance mechanosensitive channel